ncbi:MAG TPA: SPOR domain-containing protein, partial [Spirochaetia bacterium]|nr:SPOR domain-containing protein [Spirochaetia bacterium]
MEQQKVLWIIFSVALFVLVVVGVGVIWFLPSNHTKVAQTTTTQTGNQAKISFDPYEWAQSKNSNYPGLESAPAATSPAQGQSSNGGNFTIIYGQQPSQTGTTPPSVNLAAPAPSTNTTVQAVPTAPAPAPRTLSAPVHVSAAKPAAVAPKSVRVVQHWIQVASYTSDYRAEQAKKALEDKGITGKVMSRDINGKTYFRVRVGPYLTQSEAEQFLGEIKKINEFNSSYISL